jgi:hypothetical protein
MNLIDMYLEYVFTDAKPILFDNEGKFILNSWMPVFFCFQFLYLKLLHLDVNGNMWFYLWTCGSK